MNRSVLKTLEMIPIKKEKNVCLPLFFWGGGEGVPFSGLHDNVSLHEPNDVKYDHVYEPFYLFLIYIFNSTALNRSDFNRDFFHFVNFLKPFPSFLF